jgi:hypothetical protein
VTALSLLLPAFVVFVLSVGLLALALAAMFHPASSYFHGRRIPGRLLLACLLLAAALVYLDASPLALAALRSLGAVFLVDALLLKPRGTPSVASAKSGPTP